MGISWRHRNSDETQQDVPAPFAPLTDRRPDEQPAPDVEVVVKEEVMAEATSRSDDKMVLRTDNLVKKYGKRTVANHVSIDVTQGEIVGLLGPNGAGKTTTFYMTVGLIEPNEGQIFLNDLNITKFPVYKRAQNGIGYLAQEAAVIPQDECRGQYPLGASDEPT